MESSYYTYFIDQLRTINAYTIDDTKNKLLVINYKTVGRYHRALLALEKLNLLKDLLVELELTDNPHGFIDEFYRKYFKLRTDEHDPTDLINSGTLEEPTYADILNFYYSNENTGTNNDAVLDYVFKEFSYEDFLIQILIDIRNKCLLQPDTIKELDKYAAYLSSEIAYHDKEKKLLSCALRVYETRKEMYQPDTGFGRICSNSDKTLFKNLPDTINKKIFQNLINKQDESRQNNLYSQSGSCFPLCRRNSSISSEEHYDQRHPHKKLFKNLPDTVNEKILNLADKQNSSSRFDYDDIPRRQSFWKNREVYRKELDYKRDMAKLFTEKKIDK